MRNTHRTKIEIYRIDVALSQWAYLNPRPADWPPADFIVGNPPFIGKLKMREALGDGYVQALRNSWTDVPDSADFVMYWWDHAASLVRSGEAKRFGLITTNSLRQTFNRRVIEAHLGAAKNPLTLAFAVPDHPWVDSAQGAAVRIAMSVGTLTEKEGRLLTVVEETVTGQDEVNVTLYEQQGILHSDLSIGVDIAVAKPLVSNSEICNVGVIPHGEGFVLLPSNLPSISVQLGSMAIVKPFSNGKDMNSRSRGAFVIDTDGLTEGQLRSEYPEAFQWLLERVKPDRDQNPRPTRRLNWWLFGENHPRMRSSIANLRRYIATVLTSKHRTFVFVDGNILPDQTLVVLGLDDARALGELSSQVHVEWALAAGGTLEDRPRYNKSICFEPFPFPSEDTGLTPELAERIRTLAEQLDAHRKARQAAHESVTLTGLYNVLNQLRRGEPLAAKDKLLHEQGLVSVLQSLHDELDAAVLAAYGWSDLGPVPWADEAARAAWTEALLQRLVALNAKRAAEEAAGTVRWLRPEFQDPARRAAAAEQAAQASAAAAPAPQQVGIDGVESQAQAAASAAAAEAAERLAAEARRADGEHEPGSEPGSAAATATATAQPWPPTLPEQVRAVAQLLAASPAPLSLAAIEASFKGKGSWKKSLPRLLETLEALGRATRVEGGWRG